MYEAEVDPYCYRGSSVLKNLADIRDDEALAAFESAMVHERNLQSLPRGKLSVSHYKAIHRHLFQDVYSWAGRFRTVRISKGGSAFCYPDYINGQINDLFQRLSRKNFFAELEAEDFSSEAAAFLSTLNAIHPFREGNGRTQNAFLGMLASRAGHQLDFAKLDPETFLPAMIASFHGDDDLLSAEIASLIQ
ncbi:MAG: Fic family protein [Hyphomicrobium sp.]